MENDKYNNRDSHASSPLQEPNGDTDMVIRENSYTAEQKGTNCCSKWIDKLKQNESYRRKFTLSLALCWGFVCLGWLVGQFGPSFLDLRIITNNTPLEKATFFMTGHSLGYLFGSIISGILFDKCNQVLLVFFTVFLNIFVTAAIPWCSIYELMISMQFLRGFFGGGLDVSGNALLVSTWGKDPAGRSFMQALHFAFAVGGIISPLATAPFLAESTEEFSIDTNGTVNEFSTYVSMATNSTTPINFMDIYNITESSNLTLVPRVVELPTSRLYIAFLISSALSVTAAVPLFLVYLKSKKIKKNQKGDQSMSSESTDRSARQLPLTTKLILLISVASFLGLYCAVEDSFNNLLATFCVKQMHWSKVDASIVTSVFWMAFGFGRFLGIFLVKFFKPTKLIMVFCLGLASTYLGLLFVSTFMFHVGIWICCLGAGFGMSIVFPSVFTWTEENLMPVTGKIASAFLIASSTGSVVNPIVLGFLMDLLTPMWFSYLLLIESVTLCLLFLLLLLLARVIKNQYGKMDVDIKIEIKPDGAVIEEGSLLDLEAVCTEENC